MALAYDANRVARDVDARFMPHGIVHEEAMRVAEELGLPWWWLNEQASVYISGKDDAGKSAASASTAHTAYLSPPAEMTRYLRCWTLSISTPRTSTS